MIFEDLHTHTWLSSDADTHKRNSLYEKARTAKNNGVSYIAFTDHYDFDISRGINHDIDRSYKEFVTAKKELADENFTPIWSIELANVNEFRKEAREILSKYKFDFVLASLHMNTGQEDMYMQNFSDKEKYPAGELEKILDNYLWEIDSISKDFDFDSIAHIGYPLRYYKKHNRLDEIDMKKYNDRLKEILEVLIKRDKCVEINTSGLRKGYGDTFPSEEVIRMYYRLGGRKVTLGSDSHDIPTICSNIAETKRLLKNIGFTHTCVFVERKAIEIPL